MRIAFIADPQSPNAWYRAIGPGVALAQRGHELRQVWKLGGAFQGELIADCDALLIHRRHDEPVQALVRHASQHGIAVVWDNDDDMTAVPKGNVAHRRYGGLGGAQTLVAIRRILAAAQVATTPSAHLAARFEELGAARVEVIENYVRDECLAVRRRPHDGVVVGWTAGQEHHLDVERLPLKALCERLLTDHPQLHVTTIGVGLGLRDPRYRHVPKVPFTDLAGELAQLDLGIAPIADIPFNRARSNVKVKEYASVGVPWLASAVGPYAGLGEREGGRLVAREDDWHEAIARLVVKQRERRKLAKRALKWGRGQTICANADRWERLLTDAVTAARSRARTGTGTGR